MKNKVFKISLKLVTAIIIFSLLILNVTGQIKYERTVSSKFKPFKLEDGTAAYLKYNKHEKKVLIYTLDETLWKEIELPLPDNHFLDEIKSISVNTFNEDDSVELVYSCAVYKYHGSYEDPERDYPQIEFTLNVISESGHPLLVVENSNEMEIISSDGKKKMLIYKHNGSGFGDNIETLVFSLKGEK